MIISQYMPAIVATGAGLVGLAIGATFATATARDKLRMARRLMKIAVQYEAEADRTYAKIRALTEPTQSVPTVDLFPPTLGRRVRSAMAEAIERLTTRDEPLADWADGEMTQAFQRARQEENTVPATPYVGPGVSRGRERAEGGARAILPARLRPWGPRLVHGLDGPIRMPERFGTLKLPAQRKPTPLVMTRLPEDDTRQFRVKVVAA
jgi:hypothetical protein